MTNEKVFAQGRAIQKHRDLDERVALMARIASIRDSIRQYQVTLLQLEGELQVMNERYASRSQVSIDFRAEGVPVMESGRAGVS